ncbi:futalosine hydrolase [Desulfofalx alkaliphila]|uniref:futalosine hydrolase n=1 Tax=Desulfofalx alkaliphila TaxID=105483 RepID=UPI0004E1CF64|nr:futalosine hydrolase [Desulfofalx alkaliphila]
MSILIVTAVPVERDAVLQGLNNDENFDVAVSGVGPAAAAAATASQLAAKQYRLVVSAGIGGGFSGRAEVGSLAVASEIVAADLGAETPQGFCSIDQLGFGSSRIAVDAAVAKQVSQGLQRAKLPVNTGPVLTVSTVTGTAESAAEIIERVPGAVAEAMEGYGVALAAHNKNIPVIEIRAISNLVGPRDRSAWRIKESLEMLTKACSVLLEVLP